jgi:hypothetical protein
MEKRRHIRLVIIVARIRYGNAQLMCVIARTIAFLAIICYGIGLNEEKSDQLLLPRFHFLTASYISQGDIRDLKLANSLLSSRLIWVSFH